MKKTIIKILVIVSNIFNTLFICGLIFSLFWYFHTIISDNTLKLEVEYLVILLDIVISNTIASSISYYLYKRGYISKDKLIQSIFKL